MANMDLCEIETVEIRGWNKVKRVTGHRFQDFAVHRWDATYIFDPWRLTHLPSGLLVARDFPNIDAAVDAMIEVARLRNDWAVLGPEDITPELKQKVVAVAERHDGRVTAGRREYRIGYNGYGAELS